MRLRGYHAIRGVLRPLLRLFIEFYQSNACKSAKMACGYRVQVWAAFDIAQLGASPFCGCWWLR